MAGGVRAFDAARLVTLRQVAGVSQTELARRAGLAQQNLSAIERGLQWPTARMIARIADALGCAVADLVRVPLEPTLADLRRRAGLLQRDVAGALDLPPSTYGAIEQGRRELPPALVLHLARLLAVPQAVVTAALNRSSS